MTKEVAAGVLGCGFDASPAEVRKRYEVLVNEYDVRLMNAPTAALRRSYQKALQEIREACEALAPGGSPGAPQDLPSAEPAYRSDPVNVPAPPPAEAVPVAADASLPRSTIVAAVAAAVLLALLTAAILMLVRERGERRRVEAALEQVRREADTYAGVAAAFEGLLLTDRLRVRNRSKEGVRILAAAVVYVGADGRPHLAHSGSYGYPTWDMRPDQTLQIDAELGRGRDWDGRILSYALLLDYADREPFLQTGIWTVDQDRLDKVLPLMLD
jgi:hypothetical protein